MNSCNVAMMQIAEKIGKDRFYEYTKAFGMLTQSGIDLPNEAKGIFHDPDVSSEWNEVALATASFGQRFTVTPLQELNMVCAIVDDGKLKQPYVVKQVLIRMVRSNRPPRPRLSARSSRRRPRPICARPWKRLYRAARQKRLCFRLPHRR